MAANPPNPDHPLSRPPVTDPAVLLMIAFRRRYGWGEIPVSFTRGAPALMHSSGWTIDEALDFLVEWGGCGPVGPIGSDYPREWEIVR